MSAEEERGGVGWRGERKGSGVVGKEEREGRREGRVG